MSVTAHSGPYLQFGQLIGNSTNGLTGNVPPASYNDQRGPAMFDIGQALADPRAFYQYQPGQGAFSPVYSFYNSRAYVDYVPATAQASAFVAAATVTTGVSSAFTITASTATLTYSISLTAPESGNAVSVIAIESSDPSLAYNSFGQSSAIRTWAPGLGVGRTISITTSSSGDGGTWNVIGRDVYGYKMSETIAITQGTTNSSGYTIAGQKAFKYISSIINCTTPVSTGVSIGFGNGFGMPMKVPYCGHDTVVRLLASAYSSVVAVALSSANFTLPSTAATQTSTTPDVRGIYTSTTAANGTLRLQIAVTPSASAVAALTVSDMTPLFGAVQYSTA